VDLEQAILAAILDDPLEEASWAALSDWLEEQGDPRGELLRLTRSLLHVGGAGRPAREERLRGLLAAGVRPCWPVRTNSLGMRFAWCPPGAFLMGSPPEEKERGGDEKQHRVTLTKGFWLGVHEVTQALWRAVIGSNPSQFQGDDLPVEQVSWEDCQEFCQKLSALAGQPHRLPTEAEWEHACRAGTTTPFSFGDTISTDLANYDGDYTYGEGEKGKARKATTPVGTFPSNAWGLHDLHGNVWEWCQDGYARYPKNDRKDPLNEGDGYDRVLRGGSWRNRPHWCRSASRHYFDPALRDVAYGCRVVLCLD
jgi:uncharacterized protein (TIGR02996 family)